MKLIKQQKILLFLLFKLIKYLFVCLVVCLFIFGKPKIGNKKKDLFWFWTELIYNNKCLIILVGSFFIIITKTVKGHGDGKTLNVLLLGLSID